MARPRPRQDGRPNAADCRDLAWRLADTKSRPAREIVKAIWETENISYFFIFNTVRQAARAALDETPTKIDEDMTAELEKLLKEWPLYDMAHPRKDRPMSVRFHPDKSDQIKERARQEGLTPHGWMVAIVDAALARPAGQRVAGQ